MPVRERSISIGAMSGASAVGTVSTLMLAGLIIARFGWPSVFYLFGSVGFAWGVAWLLKVPVKAEAPDDTQGNYNETQKRSIPWRLLFTHPAVWTVYLASICAGAVSFTLANWLPSYFVDTFGLSLVEAGLYSTLPWIAVALSTVAAGRYADKRIASGAARIGVRKRVTATGLVLVALTCVATAGAANAVVAMVIVCALFVGLGVAIVGYSPTAAELLPDHGDVFYGIAAAGGSVGAMVFVSATGIILEKTGSYDVLFLTLTVACILTTLVYLWQGRADSIYGESTR
jgi:ACS family sodium-dependent inorganic phosphate cotransporter